MSRYFIRKAPRAGWHQTEWTVDDYLPARDIYVPEHVATDTGLLDGNGDMIMRAPRPIGFGRDDEGAGQ